MSGPKGGSYDVETASQREARLLRNAKARYARAQSLWQAAQSRVADTAAVTGKAVRCQPVAAVPAGAGSAEHDRVAAEVEAAAQAAVDAAAAAREAFVDARFADQIARIVAATATAAAVTPEADRPARRREMVAARPEVPAVDRARTAQRVQRRLAELANLDHDQDRVKVLVEDIATAEAESRIDLLISELDVMVRAGHTAAAHAASIARARADLEGLSVLLADIDDGPVDSVRRRIADLIALEATSVPAELKDDVDALIAADDARADRQHVVSSMRDALEELGYTLGPEFDVQLESSRGTAIVAGPTAGYGVKVRLEADSNRFSAQAVKSDTVVTSTEEDVEAERRFCDDFEALVALVHDDGVTLDVDVHLQPGATQVQAVAAEHVATSGNPSMAKRRRPGERERHH
ncbi:hypothetical protein ACPCIR_05840 [Mycobacterium sp. NPDC051198]